jgi:hypothetical protein
MAPLLKGTFTISPLKTSALNAHRQTTKFKHNKNHRQYAETPY